MELKQIKELMAVMQRTGTKRLRIKRNDVEVELEREDKSRVMEPPVDLLDDDHSLRQEMSIHRANMMLSRGGEMHSALHNASPTPKVEQIDSNSAYVTSPMVGTFYAAASADDAPYVKVGDKIDKETVICIVEAMKVMNEIKAGVVGTVAEILIQSGQPVEFSTKLFRITP